MPNFQISSKTLLLFLTLFASNYSSLTAKLCCPKRPQYFQHDIQLQLSDGLGFPVPDTAFWVTLDIIKQGPLVTLQLPTINFQTLNDPFEQGALPGGYLYTIDGFYPQN